MTFKPLFARSLAAAPGRLHFASHSHHLWPDASFEGQVQAWEDAARLADRKWDKIMDELWPEAQAAVANELGTGRPDAIVFSANTHDFILRLISACPRRSDELRVLTTDGEFHSARRQFTRWAEDGWFIEERVPAEPFETLGDRLVERARSGEHDLIFASQILFNSGRRMDRIDELAALSSLDGPWVVIDGYHAFMAVDRPFDAAAGERAFYLAGGYKYAMAGGGCAFLHAPPGYGPRPPVTGWYAEFEDLSLPPGRIGYAPDAARFLGATFDETALHRFVAVQRMLRDNGLTTARISAHCDTLKHAFLDGLPGTPLADAQLLNPPTGECDARFLAFRHPRAAEWYSGLKARNCITDVRGDVLRIGFALYQDDADVHALLGLIGGLE